MFNLNRGKQNDRKGTFLQVILGIEALIIMNKGCKKNTIGIYRETGPNTTFQAGFFR